MRNWQELFGDELLELEYEQLVADPAPQIRRMLDDSGLEWDERCLDFSRNERPVLTASNPQVRQPLYMNSVDRWKRYGDQLGALHETLSGRSDNFAKSLPDELKNECAEKPPQVSRQKPASKPLGAAPE